MINKKLNYKYYYKNMNYKCNFNLVYYFTYINNSRNNI